MLPDSLILISAPQWLHRPCNAPTQFYRVCKKPSVKADLAIYSHLHDVSGQCTSVLLVLFIKLDFNSCTNWDGFCKSSHIAMCYCTIYYYISFIMFFFVKNGYVNILLLINKILIVDITLSKNDQAGEANLIFVLMYANLELWQLQFHNVNFLQPIYCMCSICLLCVSYMSTVCVVYVYCMCSTCLLYV